MVISRNRKFILGGTLTALFVAGGVYAGSAFAQSASPTASTNASPAASASASASPRANQSTFLSHLAQRLNITQDQLTADMKGAAHDAVNDAVAAGRLTQQQATQINQRIDSGQGPGFGQGFALGGHGHGPKPSGAPGPRAAFGGGQAVNAAAQALNMQPSDLMSQLRSGQTLQQIADAKNVPLSTVTTAITNAIKPQLDQAVSAGRLTQQQENDILSRIGSGQFPGPGRFGFRPGPRGGAGGPSASPSPSASA